MITLLKRSAPTGVNALRGHTWSLSSRWLLLRLGLRLRLRLRLMLLYRTALVRLTWVGGRGNRRAASKMVRSYNQLRNARNNATGSATTV